MTPVAVLRRPDSNLGERILRAVESDGVLLDAGAGDARFLTLDRSGVHWRGVRLESLGALLVESPLYPWPQPLAMPRSGETYEDFVARATAEREARALAISALRVAARATRVVNDPVVAAELAAAPALALDRLENAGVPTRPWRVVARGGAGPALEVRPSAGALSALVVDGAVVAIRPGPDTESGDASRGAPEAHRDEHDLAVRATAALGLDFAAVSLSEGAVGGVDAAPDLDDWDRRSDGRVVEALCALLEATTRKEPA